MKKALKALLVTALSVSVISSVGFTTGKDVEAANAKTVKLKVAMWDAPTAKYWQEKADKMFTKANPGIKVEFESYKDDTAYLQAMKVRMAAKEMPDIFMLKPNFLQDFKTQTLPLNNMTYTKNNSYAAKYKVDGNVTAVPYYSFVEFVYYHPSIFKELNLQVPTTWPQYMNVLKKIKDNGKYVPLALGAKDSWPVYPYNEFMPQLVSGKESYLSDIANENKPFGKGTPFYKAYSKIAELYDADVMGPDPLGTSHEQATKLFETNKAAIATLGLWYASTYAKNVGNTKDLAVFPLPVRDSVKDPYTIMTFVDNFYAINKNTKNLPEAKKFMDWLFSDKVYAMYMNEFQKGLMVSTMKSYSGYSPFLKTFFDKNTAKPFIYYPGNEKYSKLINATQLDYKKIGQEMIAGKKLPDIANELNEKWSKARQNLK